MKKIRTALAAMAVSLATTMWALPASATTSEPGRTAGWLTQKLAIFEPTITRTVVYTVATDPNHMGMGRPGVYTSKSAWVDNRVPSSYIGCSATPGVGNIDCGGGIEVYPTHNEAVLRAEYIQWADQTLATDLNTPKAANEGIVYHPEYDFVGDGYLLRLSGDLSQSDANNYARVLASLTGTSVLPVHKASCTVVTPVTKEC